MTGQSQKKIKLVIPVSRLALDIANEVVITDDESFGCPL